MRCGREGGREAEIGEDDTLQTQRASESESERERDPGSERE